MALYTITIANRSASNTVYKARRDYAADAIREMARDAVRAESMLDRKPGVDFVEEADFVAACVDGGMSRGYYQYHVAGIFGLYLTIQ